MFLLHPLKRSIGWLGQLNANHVAGLHLTARQHNPHHTGLADKIALRITPKDCCPQARLELVKLVTGITEPGHFDYCTRANMHKPATSICSCRSSPSSRKSSPSSTSM